MRPGRRAGRDGHFGAALQVELVRACGDYRPGAPTGADHRPDGGAFPAARDRADDGAEGGADRAPLHRFLRLAVRWFDLAFVIDPDRLSIGVRMLSMTPANWDDRPLRWAMV